MKKNIVDEKERLLKLLSATKANTLDVLYTVYQEFLKNNLLVSLKDLNHFTLEEFIQKTAAFQKIFLNNFLSDENNEVLDLDARNIQIFDADMDKFARFLLEKKDYQITIATDFKERVKEVLSEYNIFNIAYSDSITASGTEIPSSKILLITDRELFNKRQKDVPTGRKRNYKEKAEYIENIIIFLTFNLIIFIVL